MLGAGADDLILLVARAFAGPGDVVAVADRPTYSLYRVAAELAGASVGDDDPVLDLKRRKSSAPAGASPPSSPRRQESSPAPTYRYARSPADSHGDKTLPQPIGAGADRRDDAAQEDHRTAASSVQS